MNQLAGLGSRADRAWLAESPNLLKYLKIYLRDRKLIAQKSTLFHGNKLCVSQINSQIYFLSVTSPINDLSKKFATEQYKNYSLPYSFLNRKVYRIVNGTKILRKVVSIIHAQSITTITCLKSRNFEVLKSLSFWPGLPCTRVRRHRVFPDNYARLLSDIISRSYCQVDWLISAQHRSTWEKQLW